MFSLSFIENKRIVLFDGSCGLCNKSIKFIIRHEKKKELYFSALQSEFGTSVLKHFGLVGQDSIVFIENGKAFIKSGAAIRICKYLKIPWPMIMGFIIVPPFIRNFFYDFIARNRIKWFGVAEYCEMITPELRKRFLD